MEIRVLEVLAATAIAATVAILLVGVGGLLRGGEFNRRYGNTLMRARVAMQAVAILLLVILFMLRQG